MPEDIVGELHPRRKRFETHDIRRPPVECTQIAKDWFVSSSAQGRLFPQALAEAFGILPGVERIFIDIAPSGSYVDSVWAGVALCQVTILNGNESTSHLFEAETLRDVHASGHPAFHAMDAAMELLRIDDMQRSTL